MMQHTFIDLFAGAGGFSEGLLLAGGRERRFLPVGASDISPVAKLTYENRFKKQLGLNCDFLVADIREPRFADKLVELVTRRIGKQHVDVVVGGPPCQGFSVFGARNEADPRNDLFVPYLRAIERLRPKYFVVENVPGLATMYGGKTIDRIRSMVARMRPVRYEVTGPIKVNAADFGVPQLRDRILFVGHRKDVPAITSIPKTHRDLHVTVEEAIGDLSFLRPWERNGRYHDKHPALTGYQQESRAGRLYSMLGIERKDQGLKNHDAAKHTPDIIARFAMIEPGEGLDSIPRELWDTHLKSSKKWCVRLRPDAPSYTVVTLPDDFVHYRQHRILTVRELARLQSFDDTFEFLGPRATGGGGRGKKKRNHELPQYSQVGNAVPPLLAKGIGQVLRRALDSL